MAPTLLATQGVGRFLIGVGRGPFDTPAGVELGRVFDRPRQKLGDPLPVASITARGYWEPIGPLAEGQRSEILAEVAALL